MSKAFVLGLTGPTGSGKSAVAKIFCDKGYKLVDADKIARDVVSVGSPVIDKLADRFGEDIVLPDGNIDRKLLSSRAFSSKENTKALNEITHPAIVELVRKSIEDYAMNGYTRIIYDAPLLFESGTDKLCDKVLSVVADKDIRVERLKARDNISEFEIKKRIDAQFDNEFYTSKSDFVIENNLGLEAFSEKTEQVFCKIEKVNNGTL